MYNDLDDQLQRLRHSTRDLAVMKRDILFGLFHAEECMQEAIGVAAEILAARFLQASNEHGKAEKRAAKEAERNTAGKVSQEAVQKAAELETQFVAEEAAAEDKRHKEEDKRQSDNESFQKSIFLKTHKLNGTHETYGRGSSNMAFPHIGCKISLLSKHGIRYEGTLYTIDPNDSTIALSNGKQWRLNPLHQYCQSTAVPCSALLWYRGASQGEEPPRGVSGAPKPSRLLSVTILLPRPGRACAGDLRVHHLQGK